MACVLRISNPFLLSVISRKVCPAIFYIDFHITAHKECCVSFQYFKVNDEPKSFAKQPTSTYIHDMLQTQIYAWTKRQRILAASKIFHQQNVNASNEVLLLARCGFYMAAQCENENDLLSMTESACRRSYALYMLN